MNADQDSWTETKRHEKRVKERETCARSGIGTKDDPAVVGDADDRRSHGVRGVKIEFHRSLL